MKHLNKHLFVPAAACLAGGMFASENARADQKYDYGEYLSGECTTCHKSASNDGAIPVIAGMPVGQFLAALKGYKDGTRANKAMQIVARNLTDEDMEALAIFFLEQGKRE